MNQGIGLNSKNQKRNISWLYWSVRIDLKRFLSIRVSLPSELFLLKEIEQPGKKQTKPSNPL
jgi:hypothetical protein